MKLKFSTLLIILLSLTFTTCSDSKIIEEEIIDPVSESVDPIYQLTAEANIEYNEIMLNWKNPHDKNLIKVEISYKNKELNTRVSPKPILLDATPGSSGNTVIEVATSGVYIIQVVAINKAGARSSATTTECTVNASSIVEEDHSSVFLSRADTLMTTLMDLYLGGQYDVWNNSYPNATGPYWGGAAAVWGQGAGLSAYTALRRASTLSETLKAKYSGYDDRFFTSMEQFKNNLSGKGSYAYGTFLGNNDERYYDDNVWIGIDMADLYIETQEVRYLSNAKMVWNFILEGTDDVTGGGVYWKEGSKSKHTCSTAPAAVLAVKLYQITGEDHFLDAAKDYYAWCKDVLQDPADYLYWDNAILTDENDLNSPIRIEKNKYSYNSGQPMQVAAMLYEITNDSRYLTDAQNIAEAAYKKWFLSFKSYILDETIQILDPGNTWFQAIMFRGYIELYEIDGNRKYIEAYENTMHHAWLSSARDKKTKLLSTDFRGGVSHDSWGLLEQAACVEILARLAILEE